MKQAIEYIRTLWDFLVYENELEKADAIVGFGSNDIIIAERAAKLFLDGFAPHLLFSGGLGKGTEGIWNKSEAETFRDIAVSLGVDSTLILVENKSTNTGENIRFSKQLLQENGIEAKTIIFVHQPNMGRRIYAAIKKQWPEVCPLIAPSECTLEQYLIVLGQTGVDENDLFSNIVGDFQRIDVFAKEGYQIPQEIPEDAEEAFDALCKLGYTKYVI